MKCKWFRGSGNIQKIQAICALKERNIGFDILMMPINSYHLLSLLIVQNWGLENRIKINSQPAITAWQSANKESENMLASMQFSLNGTEFLLNSVNSTNSENLINHWSMNWGQLIDPFYYLYLAGTVAKSSSFTREVTGLSPFTVMTNALHLGKHLG